MSDQTISDDETSPLLVHQGTKSGQTLVGDENARRTNDKEAHGKNLSWILVAVWSADFLSALDGKLPVDQPQLGTVTFMKPQERWSLH